MAPSLLRRKNGEVAERLKSHRGVVQLIGKNCSGLFMALLLFSPTATMAGGWQQPVAVDRIVNEGEEDGSRTYVAFSQTFNPDSCPNSGFVRVYGQTRKGEQILAALMTALAAGKMISPNLAGCDDWGRAIMAGITLSR